MKILVTNDDGVHAEGLWALARALRPLGEVTVVAPAQEQSAASHAITMAHPLRLRQGQQEGWTYWAVQGTPADCVLLAIKRIIPGGPDLVASGINRGANLGEDMIYSGTVAAAREAAIQGIPALAISNVSSTSTDFGPGAAIAVRLAQQILQHGLPPQTLLNVNVPDCPADALRGVRVTRQGRRVYRSTYVERRDPRGGLYYWLGAERPEDENVPGTDVAAVQAGYISVTPIHLDMTAHEALDTVAGWVES